MDELGDALLARAGLPLDPDVLVARRDAPHQVQDLAHGIAFPHDAAAQLGGARGLHLVHLALHAAELRQRANARHQILVEEGLQHIVIGPVPDGLHRCGDRAVAGDHDHLDVRPQALGRLEQLDAVLAGHADVGDQEVVALPPQPAQGGVAVADQLHGVPGILERVAERHGDAAFVIGEHDLHRIAPYRRSQRGARTP